MLKCCCRIVLRPQYPFWQRLWPVGFLVDDCYQKCIPSKMFFPFFEFIFDKEWLLLLVLWSKFAILRTFSKLFLATTSDLWAMLPII